MRYYFIKANVIKRHSKIFNLGIRLVIVDSKYDVEFFFIHSFKYWNNNNLNYQDNESCSRISLLIPVCLLNQRIWYHLIIVAVFSKVAWCRFFYSKSYFKGAEWNNTYNSIKIIYGVERSPDTWMAMQSKYDLWQPKKW